MQFVEHLKNPSQTFTVTLFASCSYLLRLYEEAKTLARSEHKYVRQHKRKKTELPAGFMKLEKCEWKNDKWRIATEDRTVLKARLHEGLKHLSHTIACLYNSEFMPIVIFSLK